MVFLWTQTATPWSDEPSFVMTGRRAPPIDSWASPIWIWKPFHCPAAEFAAVAAAPPVVRASSAMIASMSPDARTALSIPGTSFPREVVCPA